MTLLKTEQILISNLMFLIMTLKILMVDGYDFDGWKSLRDSKCIDAFEHFSNTLKSISLVPLEIVTIHPGKNKEFYKEAFNRSGKRVTWIFGLDGLPEDSYKYRVNQDGVHLFEMMKMGSKMGVNIVWQYIVFKYNQNNIEQSKQMAKDYNMEFRLSKSSRWQGRMIHMKPEEFYCFSGWKKQSLLNLKLILWKEYQIQFLYIEKNIPIHYIQSML